MLEPHAVIFLDSPLRGIEHFFVVKVQSHIWNWFKPNLHNACKQHQSSFIPGVPDLSFASLSLRFNKGILLNDLGSETSVNRRFLISVQDRRLSVFNVHCSHNTVSCCSYHAGSSVVHRCSQFLFNSVSITDELK